MSSDAASSTTSPDAWIVAQLGAREHYAVPRALAAAGSLAMLITDLYLPWAPRLESRLWPTPLKALAGRHHPNLRSSLVRSTFTRRARGQGVVELFRDFIAVGAAFDRSVTARLERERPAADAFFGFNTGCLEALAWAKANGALAVVDQIDPGRTEERLVEEERALWPGWEPPTPGIPDDYFARLDAEWKTADCVVVNSEWSRRALIEQGVPPAKLAVIPLTYEYVSPFAPRPPRADLLLHVVWVGTVNLRKGIQYLAEAARLLQNAPVRFTIAGPLAITPAAVRAAPPSMRFLGRLARSDALRLYREADVLVLPTVSDGFGLVQLEAMANGVPVVTTPNCGKVVTDGVDGLIVPARDAPALAEALRRLAGDPELLARLALATRSTAERFPLARVSADLIGLLNRRARKG